MRVRISYSVDLDDVPNECARMLNDTLREISKVSLDIEAAIKDVKGTRYTMEMEKLYIDAY